MRRILACILLLCSLIGFSRLQLSRAASNAITASISVNGYTRRFVYAISDAAAPANGRPLVIHLHGDGGNMGLSVAWKQAILQDTSGAVLLSAQGRNNIDEAAGIDGSAWRMRMDEAGRKYDDVDFINQIISQATANPSLLGTKIDPDQVYVVGESRGAAFAYFLYADPRTRNKIRAIVPISGTFYCDGEVGDAKSDTVCGEVSTYGYWGPKPSLFTSLGGVTRRAHILDIHGQLSSGEGNDTAPPRLDQDYESSTWTGWADAAGCYSVQVSSKTQQTLPYTIGGRTIKTYAYSQSATNLAIRCSTLDLTFYIAQGGGHVPGGFETTAWCYLSTVGGNPSNTACVASGSSTPIPTPTLDHKLFTPFITRE